MAVRLRSLRVSAELDGTGFTAGAQKLKSDVDQVRNSLSGFGVSLASADQSLSRMPAGMARLSRSWVQGYAEADRFERTLRQIDKALGEGMDMDRAVTMVTNLEQAFGRAASVADLARAKLVAVAQAVSSSRIDQSGINGLLGVGSSGKSASQSADVFRDALAEQDRLAASAARLIDEVRPLEALQRRHSATISEYSAMLRVGAITQDDFNIAVERQKQSFAVQSENIKRTGNNVRLTSHEMANLGAQFQDIAVMMAAGQSPFMTIMQQGMQIVPVLGDQGVGGALKRLGAGFIGFATNPLNLAILGFAGLAWAAQSAFSSISQESKKSETALEKQQRLLSQVKDTFKGINYESSVSSMTMLRIIVGVSIDESRKQIAKDIEALSADIVPRWQGGGRSGAIMLNKENLPFKEAIKDLNKAVKDGAPDIDVYLERIGRIAEDSSDEKIKKAAAAIGDMSKEIVEAAQRADALSRSLDPLARQFRALQSARDLFGNGPGLDTLTSFVPDLTPDPERMRMTADMMLRTATNMSMVKAVTDEMAKAESYWAKEREKTFQLNALELESIYAKTPAMKAAIAAERERISLSNTATSQVDIEIAAQNAYRQAYESSAYAISEATRQLRENVSLEMQSINAKSPAQKARIAAERERLAALNSGASAEEANARAVLQSGLAYAQAAHAIEESNRTRLRAANDNLATQRLELSLIGAATYERSLQTANLQTLLDLQRQAAQNGLEFDQRQYELLKQKNVELARTAQMIAEGKLQNDINKERGYLGMSGTEADIAKRLDGAGIGKASEAYKGLADQLRSLDALQQTFSFGASQGFEEIVRDANNFAESGKQLVTDLYSGLEDVWVNFAKTGKLSFRSLIDTMIGDLSKLTYKIAMSGLLNAIGGGASSGGGGMLGSLFGSIFGSFGGGTLGVNPLYADGGVFTNSIVQRPTAFTSGSRLGVMGEAGPEAVMPLTRTAGGKLGVVASGSGGVNSISLAFNPSVTINGSANEKDVNRAIAQQRRDFEVALPGMIKKVKSAGRI